MNFLTETTYDVVINDHKIQVQKKLRKNDVFQDSRNALGGER